MVSVDAATDLRSATSLKREFNTSDYLLTFKDTYFKEHLRAAAPVWEKTKRLYTLTFPFHVIGLYLYLLKT